MGYDSEQKEIPASHFNRLSCVWVCVCVFIFELIECFYSLFGYRYEKKLLLTFIDKTVRCNFKALNKLRNMLQKSDRFKYIVSVKLINIRVTHDVTPGAWMYITWSFYTC